MKNTLGSFYDKMYAFIMKKQLFFSLCSVLDTFIKIKKKKNKYDTLENLETIFEEALDDFKDHSWENIIGKIIDSEIIKGCYPHIKIDKDQNSLNNLSVLMEKLYI